MNKKFKIMIGIAVLILIIIASVFMTLVFTGKAVVEFTNDDLDFNNSTKETDSNCIKISEVKKLCKLGTFEVKAGEIKEGDFNVK